MECIASPPGKGEKTETEDEALRQCHCNAPKEVGHVGVRICIVLTFSVRFSPASTKTTRMARQPKHPRRETRLILRPL